MTAEELFDCALQARIQGGAIGITLVFPRSSKRPPGFPRGELLCDKAEHGKVYSFDPEKIMRWVLKNNLIQSAERVKKC